MAPRAIIDSHIHLWPQSMSNEDGHSWMTPGMPLAKEHVLSDYYKASQQDDTTEVEGVIYVETDVRYENPSDDLKTWAKGPLDEIKFLRAIVEGEYGEQDSKTLLGIVAWAPMDQPTSVLKEWLRLAEETAGPETWSRVKGFRFLLQAITDRLQFESLVQSEAFLSNLKLLGKEGFSFDIGVDQRSGGAWQLGAIARTISEAHADVPSDEEKVTVILNHFCKPDFAPNGPAFESWRNAMKALSRLPKTYMKLSGAFSELPATVTETADASAIATCMRPWTEHVFWLFGPSRVMFGSDWPVCNVSGPGGEKGSWAVWRDVVRLIVDFDGRRLNEEHKDWVWRRTAREAYRIV